MTEINLYGEIHPEHVGLLRNVPENLSFLNGFIDKVALLPEVTQNLFYDIMDRITDDYYSIDLRLYDSMLDEFYSGLKAHRLGNKVLLMEGVLTNAREVELKLRTRHLSSSLFNKTLLIDKSDFRFKEAYEREMNWLTPIKKFINEGFNLIFIAGYEHFINNESCVSKNKLKYLFPNDCINTYIMPINYSPDFIQDSNEINRIISRFE